MARSEHAHALIVMAREPSPGTAKTRLSPPLSAQEAAALYRCFLVDTLVIMQLVEDAQSIIAYSPPQAEAVFRRIAPAGFDIMPQVGIDLGERLSNVITQCLENGYRSVVVIGSDSPTLPVGYVAQAFSALDTDRVNMVLGPSDDGGYYLIGLTSPCPALFQGIVMSTPTVAAETLAAAHRQGLQVTCLPTWYDVDRPEDLERLLQELRSRSDHPAEHTRRFLSQVMGYF